MSMDTIQPSDLELVKASQQLEKAVTSRGELLVILDTLDLEEISLNEKMVYLMGLVSLGFDVSSARKRLRIKPVELASWKQEGINRQRLDECRSRGKMIFEEKVLTAAEQDPDIAIRVYERMEKKEEKEDEAVKEKERDIEDMVAQGLKDRGLIIDAELLD